MTTNKKHIRPFFGFVLIITLVIYSCSKLYVKHDFRQTYQSVNDTIHQNLRDSSFFKVHLKNGNVSVLNQWKLNDSKDSISGNGKLFDFNRAEIRNGSISHKIDEIAIIETNNLEAIKSRDDSKISSLAILTGANVILDVVCITNPKACFGSCPTFYTNNSESVHHAKAEGFSSSISPALETSDLDALRYSTSDELFNLTMKNEAFETHVVNELFLNVVPKYSSQNVFQDGDKNFYRSDNLYQPNSAKVENKNIIDLITFKDDKEYNSKTDGIDLTAKEEIFLEFENIPANNLGLTINYRQSLLTTFLLYNGLSYMGDEVGDYFTKIETNKYVRKRLRHPFKLLGKIKFFAWDSRKDKWTLFDELYETGPIAKNLMVAPLEDIVPVGGKLKIKIELTKGLWKIDHLGLAQINKTADVSKIYPKRVDVVEGEEVTIDHITQDDDNYLISFPGNEYIFQFELPDLINFDEHELFLSSKGYYLEWIRANWLKDKDVEKLEKMLSNDTETWAQLAREYKAVEDEMEQVFWNSQYINLQ